MSLLKILLSNPPRLSYEDTRCSPLRLIQRFDVFTREAKRLHGGVSDER